MRLFKIKHKPTGLYYTPRKGRWTRNKTNLSKKGKVYQKRPSIKHISAWLSISHKLAEEHGYKEKDVDEWKEIRLNWTEDDWEIIEYETRIM